MFAVEFGVSDAFATKAVLRILSLREAPLGGVTKQSSWIATARFALLAMTILRHTLTCFGLVEIVRGLQTSNSES